MTPQSRRLAVLTLPLFLSVMAPSLALADDPKMCCRIIRVDMEKRHVWMRNPRGGQVAQIPIREGDTTEFKINDVFDPEAHTLNGQKLEHVYPIVVPDLPPPNAKILRARGAEMAVAMDETQTVYRVYALKFGIVLSSVRPGEALYVDEAERWAFIRLEERGKVKPSVWAFRLD